MMTHTSLTRSARFLYVIWMLALVQCAGGESKEEESPMTIQLTSPAFEEGKPIPKTFTCDGSDVSPPLEWTRVPKGTKSLALICDDPDAPAGTWVHWVLYGLPPDTTSLGEAVPADEILENGAVQGTNDFKRTGYGGPCPPGGKPHRYFFKLYALDTQLDLAAGATKKDLEKAMKGHMLADGRLMGTYQRERK